MSNQNTVSTCLWFESGGRDAAKFYVSLIPGSTLDTSADGPEPMVVPFTLAGQRYSILNGGDMFGQTPAVSIMVTTSDQAETDRLWDALTADGGQESRCGWLKDRWGVSWQIIPAALPSLLGATDRAAAERALQAMMNMSKIDIAVLEKAAANHI